jgi:GT2 family glycosyltransferase
MKLHIVIPVINCLDLTKSCIETINEPCTIHLIDNASDDGTQQWGHAMMGEEMMGGRRLDYIRNDEPNSVAGSWNQGVKASFADPECKYVCILNNDAMLHPKTLAHLMQFQDKTGYLLVTAENVKGKFNEDQDENIRLMIETFIDKPYTDFDLMPIEGWQAEGPDFSCFMINRETIEIIGWFDEKFLGAYCEDQDYHARFQRAREWGKEYGEPDAKRCHAKRLTTAPYHHYASQTMIRNPALRQKIAQFHANNQNYYLLKWGAEHPQVMDGQGNRQPFGDATKNWTMW